MKAAIEFDVPSWLVKEESDKCEGRGPWNDVGHFFDEAAAVGAARGKGAMGQPGHIRRSHAIRLTLEDGRADSVDPQHLGPISAVAKTEAIVKAARAKLTKEELEALGLLGEE